MSIAIDGCIGPLEKRLAFAVFSILSITEEGAKRNDNSLARFKCNSANTANFPLGAYNAARLLWAKAKLFLKFVVSINPAKEMNFSPSFIVFKFEAGLLRSLVNGPFTQSSKVVFRVL
jgi:hypothetical protein